MVVALGCESQYLGDGGKSITIGSRLIWTI